MWPRIPTTVYSCPSRAKEKVGTRPIFARFILPAERIEAMRTAVLNFSVTMSFRTGPATPGTFT